MIRGTVVRVPSGPHVLAFALSLQCAMVVLVRRYLLYPTSNTLSRTIQNITPRPSLSQTFHLFDRLVVTTAFCLHGSFMMPKSKGY